jgi:hypothetical protein
MLLRRSNFAQDPFSEKPKHALAGVGISVVPHERAKTPKPASLN